MLEPTKAAVLTEFAKRTAAKVEPDAFLRRKSGQLFYNTSPLDLKKLMGDQDHVAENLRKYLRGFSPAVRDIFEHFEFHTQIDRLAKAGLLYLVTEKFATIDLHPDAVSNAQMGAVFEELIRKFAELSNETAGEHFTPREVIRLMVNLLFIEDDEALSKPGVVRSLYDPTAGTGGMLSVADEHLASLNPDARLVMFGQELNPESYAICGSDLMIKGEDMKNIVFGNTLGTGKSKEGFVDGDGHSDKKFHYMLANPPFGVEWKPEKDHVTKEQLFGVLALAFQVQPLRDRRVGWFVFVLVLAVCIMLAAVFFSLRLTKALDFLVFSAAALPTALWAGFACIYLLVAKKRQATIAGQVNINGAPGHFVLVELFALDPAIGDTTLKTVGKQEALQPGGRYVFHLWRRAQNKSYRVRATQSGIAVESAEFTVPPGKTHEVPVLNVSVNLVPTLK